MCHLCVHGCVLPCPIHTRSPSFQRLLRTPQVPFYRAGEQPLLNSIRFDEPDYSWPPRPHQPYGGDESPSPAPVTAANPLAAAYADVPQPSALVIDLLQRVLTKDPSRRATLVDIAGHPWLAGEEEMDGFDPANPAATTAPAADVV